MANRRLGAMIFASIYSTTHYLVVAGEFLKGTGFGQLYEPFATIFHLSFWFSVAIVAAILLPKLLRAIIWICGCILNLLVATNKFVDLVVDSGRILLIALTESLLRSLRSVDTPKS